MTDERKVEVADPKHVTAGERAALIAKVALEHHLTSAGVISDYSSWISKPTLNALADSLIAWDGKLGDLEQMLHAQAYALDSIFAQLARRANATTDLRQFEAYGRLALKAQNQARMTVATLGELKNPRPVAFVHQANVSAGPMQVNNGPMRAEENSSEPIKQLEATHGEWLDGGAATSPGRAHQDLETVGAVERTEDTTREGAVLAQRMEGRPASVTSIVGASAQRTAQAA